jgi:cytochrome b561
MSITSSIISDQNCIDYLYAFARRLAKTKKTFTQMLSSVVQCYDQVFMGLMVLMSVSWRSADRLLRRCRSCFKRQSKMSKVKIILCTCLMGVSLMGVALMGVALMGVSLTGVALMGVALMGISLTGVSHRRTSHRRGSYGCVSHGRGSHGCGSHGSVSWAYL